MQSLIFTHKRALGSHWSFYFPFFKEIKISNINYLWLIAGLGTKLSSLMWSIHHFCWKLVHWRVSVGRKVCLEGQCPTLDHNMLKEIVPFALWSNWAAKSSVEHKKFFEGSRSLKILWWAFSPPLPGGPIWEAKWFPLKLRWALNIDFFVFFVPAISLYFTSFFLQLQTL